MVGFLRSLVNREPAMVLSTIIGVSALCLPFIVIPIRRSMGLPTYQWDADVETHPVRARGWAAHSVRAGVPDQQLLTDPLSSHRPPPPPSLPQYLHAFTDGQKRYTFDDVALLSTWSKHDQYRYKKKLTHKDHDDPTRDFPEARARLQHKAW